MFSGLSRFLGLGSESLEKSNSQKADMHLARYLLSTGTSINMVRHSSIMTMFKILNHHTFSPEEFQDKIMYMHAEQTEGEMVQLFKNTRHFTIAVESLTTELRRDNSCVYRVSASRRDGYSFTVALMKLETEYISSDNLWKAFNGIFWRLGIAKTSRLVTDSTDVLVEFSKKLDASSHMASGFTCLSIGLSHVCTSIFKCEVIHEMMATYEKFIKELSQQESLRASLSPLREEIGEGYYPGRSKSHLYVNRFLSLFRIITVLNANRKSIQALAERGLSQFTWELCQSGEFWERIGDLQEMFSPLEAVMKKCESSPIYLSDAYVYIARVISAIAEKRDTEIGCLLSEHTDRCLTYLKTEYLGNETFNQAILLDPRYQTPNISPEGIVTLTNHFVMKQNGDSKYRKVLCNEFLDFVSLNRVPENLNNDPLQYWCEANPYKCLPQLALSVFRIIANPLSPARKMASMGWIHSPGANELPGTDLGIFMNTFLYLNWDDLKADSERVLINTAYNNVGGEELERIQEDAVTEAFENHELFFAEFARDFNERLYGCNTFVENVSRQMSEEQLGHLWSKRTTKYL